MTDPDLPDSGMASGSDAGEPGEHLGSGDLRPDEERLLAELERGVDGAPDAGDAELRAAEDEAPLPAEGGGQDDGLTAEFSDRDPTEG
ncbi:hypothetical protein [Geodermatophilus maliterrae]|uniref:DUF5709 domain-containing protein n=1 Tax=Geodermatophilus maliterrae TaxID=3162531 RepID=A0ABV3XEU3_9ACTN